MWRCWICAAFPCRLIQVECQFFWLKCNSDLFRGYCDQCLQGFILFQRRICRWQCRIGIAQAIAMDLPIPFVAAVLVLSYSLLPLAPLLHHLSPFPFLTPLVLLQSWLISTVPSRSRFLPDVIEVCLFKNAKHRVISILLQWRLSVDAKAKCLTFTIQHGGHDWQRSSNFGPAAYKRNLERSSTICFLGTVQVLPRRCCGNAAFA